MIHAVRDLAQVVEIADIAYGDLDGCFNALQVVDTAGRKVVENNHLVPLAHQKLRDMAADEPSPTRDQKPALPADLHTPVVSGNPFPETANSVVSGNPFPETGNSPDNWTYSTSQRSNWQVTVHS